MSYLEATGCQDWLAACGIVVAKRRIQRAADPTSIFDVYYNAAFNETQKCV
jgi:hypothetical protein